MKILSAVAAIVLVGFMAGCGDNAVSTNVPQGHGAVKVQITDGPIDLATITHLYVTFERLYASPKPDSVPPDSLGDLRPIEIIPPGSPVTLDLLTLTNGLTADLGLATLPEGNYRALILVLKPGSSWLVTAEGDTDDVIVPSSHLKIVTNFTVTDGGVSEIILEMDAAASLIQTGNGKYILRPVIRQLPDRPLAASIEGKVWVQTPTGLVSAGDYMVANPRHGHRGMDMGHGNRPGDKRGNGHGGGMGGGPPDTSATLPLTVAWPMIVHASVSGQDSTDDDEGDDSTFVGARLGPLAGDDLAAFFRPHPHGTMVRPNGTYMLWRLRKGATFNLRLFLHPRSGFEVVQSPVPVVLNGDVTGQDFIIREKAGITKP